MKKKLLINWVVWHAIAHVVEILKCRAWVEADPELEVHLMLNSNTATDIAASCPWISRVYPVDVHDVCQHGENAKTLAGIPREWDYIAYDKRMAGLGPEDVLRKTFNVTDVLFNARVAKSHWQDISLPYKPGCRIELPVPEEAAAFAGRFRHDGTRGIHGPGPEPVNPCLAEYLPIPVRVLSRPENLFHRRIKKRRWTDLHAWN